MKEVWKDVKHYEGLYKISNFGRIWSYKTNQYRHPSVKDNGYLAIVLHKDGVKRNEYIHRLVALTFLENPNGYPQINHKDEDKQNNRVDNLEWCDAQYNNTYGTARARGVATTKERGGYKKARQRMCSVENPAVKNPKYRGSNSYAKRVFCDGKEFDCIKDCAEYYNVNYSTMRGWMCGTLKIPNWFVDKNLHYVD